jgi:quinol monooxygenase YgiN
MHLIVRRKLNDFDTWRTMVNDMEGIRKDYGSRGMTVYRSAEAPNEVTLVIEWDDNKPWREYFGRPDVQEALKASGDTTDITEVSERIELPS